MSFKVSDSISTQDIDRSVFLDRLHQTGKLLPSTWFITIPLIVWSCFPMITQNSTIKVAIWCVIACSLTTARALLSLVLRKCTLDNDLVHFEYLHTLVGLAAALSISFGFVHFSPLLDISWQMLFSIIIISLSMGATFTLLYTASNFFTYVSGMMLPIGFAQVMYGNEVLNTLGYLTISAVPLLCIYYYKQHKIALKGLYNFYEGKALLYRQKAIFNAAPNGIIFTRSNLIIDVNDFVLSLFGYDSESLVGKDINYLFADALLVRRLAATADKHYTSKLSTREVTEIQAVRSDGSNFWTELACSATTDFGSKKQVGIVWIISDLTERKSIEERLQQQQVMYQGLVETANDLVFYLDERFCFSYVNPRGAMRVLGRSKEELIGLPIHSILAEDADLFEDTASGNFLELGSTVEREVSMLHTDGDIKLIKLSITPILSISGTLMGIAGTAADITPHKQTEEHMLYLAMHDELTGLPNRRLFIDRLQQAMKQFDRRSGQLALLMIDLDRFKFVNDTLGHNVGDCVLEMSAYRLRSCVRSSDTVARLGGDEFVILLPEVNSVRDVEVVAEKIVKMIGEPLSISGQHVQVYASVGIALYPADGDSADKLMAASDEAMYEAKHSGCNCYCFYGQEQKKSPVIETEPVKKDGSPK